MTKKAPPYSSEADMCAQFIAEIGDAWTAYPETSGWDILLVRQEDGFQIGVEAKLKLNAKVLTQAMESHYSNETGPDCRAVLVPECEGNELTQIADYIGITVIQIWPKRPYNNRGFNPSLPEEKPGQGSWWNEKWHEQCPMKRCTLPEYVPDVAAGSSAPVRLTDWKIRAIKAAILVEKNGVITRADFKHLKLDHRRWIARDYGWLRPNEAGTGYIVGVHFPNYRLQHPRVYGEIEADFDNWKPSATQPAKQEKLI